MKIILWDYCMSLRIKPLLHWQIYCTSLVNSKTLFIFLLISFFSYLTWNAHAQTFLSSKYKIKYILAKAIDFVWSIKFNINCNSQIVSSDQPSYCLTSPQFNWTVMDGYYNNNIMIINIKNIVPDISDSHKVPPQARPRLGNSWPLRPVWGWTASTILPD